MDAQIPGQLDSKLKPLFGEAGLHVTSGLDPAIPLILKPIDSGQPQDAKVVAINCEKELGAVIAKADHLGQIETWYLLLRQTTVTYWQGHYMYWVRCKQTPGEKPSLGPDYSVKLGDGIFFIGQGLIPIASSSADGDVFLVRQGTIPWVDLRSLFVGTTVQARARQMEACLTRIPAQ